MEKIDKWCVFGVASSLLATWLEWYLRSPFWKMVSDLVFIGLSAGLSIQSAALMVRGVRDELAAAKTRERLGDD